MNNNHSKEGHKSEMEEGNIVNINIFNVVEQEACHVREHMGKEVNNLEHIKTVQDTVNDREIEVRKEPFSAVAF